MAKISLREYQREIEKLIDRGEINEAIAHCKHILKYYPKNIDTYRLFGSALLESQHYTEAADVLQRVLSVFPDDFISHIGMSVIREDEHNLDAAIWHMERAFEIQPYNKAVQEELKRLFRQRDKVEPDKVRLTRGALVRMYAKGNLYAQAIGEIRAALIEAPQRYDLYILLARMYLLSGQKNEAIEACNQVLAKLPYALEANQILATLLQDSSRKNEASTLQQRLVSLDPYAAFVPAGQTTSDVPDQQILLEHLDWSPEQEPAVAPSWAQTIGVSWDEEPSPDWAAQGADENGPDIALQEAFSKPAAEQSFAEDQPTLVPALEGLSPAEEGLPEWMASAGWQPSNGEVQEGPVDFSEEPAAEESAEIAPAEIPDWLQEMAPKEDLAQPDLSSPATPPASPSGQEDLSWLSTILSEPQAEKAGEGAFEAAAVSAPAWIFDQDQEETPPPNEGVADGFSAELSSGQNADLPAEPAAEEEIPDWLKDLEPATETVGTPLASGNTSLEDEEQPDWLRAIAGEPAPEISSPVSPLEPLADLPISDEFGGSNPKMEEPTLSEPSDEMPSWLKDMLSEEQPSEALSPEALETAISQPAAEAAPADLSGEIPAWLREIESQVDQTAPVEAIPAEAISAPQPATPPAAEQPEEDLDAAMAWLESLAARQGADEATLSTTPEERSATPPAWILESQAEVPEKIEPEEVLPEPMASADIPVVAETPQIPDLTDDEAAFAWLEALAQKQGAEQETLITRPEDRLEKPPQWIEDQKAAFNTPEEGELSTPAEESPALPAWLTQLEAENSLESETSFEPEATTPQAKKEEEATPEPFVPPTSQASEIPVNEISVNEPPVDEIPAGEVPAWLEQITGIQEIEKPLEVPFDESAFVLDAEPASDTQPVHLAKPEPVETATGTSETSSEAAPAVEIPDWLFEASQSAEEPVQLTSEASAESPAASIPAVEQPEQAFEMALETPVAEEVTANSYPPVEWSSDESEYQETAEVEPILEITSHPSAEEPTSSAPDEVVAAQVVVESVTSEALANAKELLLNGRIEKALAHYIPMIQSGQHLEDAIHDLRDSLYRYPVDINLWQTLGDAYLRNNQIQEALDAYTQAEELLK